MHCSVKSFCRDSSVSIFKKAFNFPNHIVQVNEKISGNNEVETLMTLLESSPFLLQAAFFFWDIPFY